MKEVLLPKSKAQRSEKQRADALGCARLLAATFRCSQPHSEKVAAAAEKIFDKMKKFHGLGSSKRFLLELAAILHECGYYIHPKLYSVGIFQLLKNMDLYGVAEEELEILAAVFLSLEEELSPGAAGRPQKLVVSKLSAIFRLADALDYSQKQKLKNLKVRLDKNRLVLSVESLEDAALEQWAFRQAVPFFEDVFGVRPNLSYGRRRGKCIGTRKGVRILKQNKAKERMPYVNRELSWLDFNARVLEEAFKKETRLWSGCAFLPLLHLIWMNSLWCVWRE